MGSVSQITIGSATFDVFGSQALAKEYFSAHATGFEAWRALTGSQEKRALVSAARLLERQRWAGEKTLATQPLPFPRTGIVDREGTPIDSATIPDDVCDAQYEIALLLATGETSVQDSSSTQSNLKERTTNVGRGAVVTTRKFFSPSAVPSIANGRFPQVIQELLSPYLQSGSITLEVAYGATESSQFCDDKFGVELLALP